MKIGIIGYGVIGSALGKWLKEHTNHELKIYDPDKGYKDSLIGCEAIFISVPVPSNAKGQDQRVLSQSVELAKKHSDKVFIRSTVQPGTNDNLGTISVPEFLTERRAYEDFCKFPIISGECDQSFLERVFPNKQIIMVSNLEAELGKKVHNCFLAVKVLMFNLFNEICEAMGADYENVLKVALMTKYILPTHTIIRQDGLKGYGGKCFPENMVAMVGFLDQLGMEIESDIIQRLHELNEQYRKNSEVIYGVEA